MIPMRGAVFMRLYEVESSNASDNQFITSNDIISILSELNDFIKGKNNENELKMLLQTFINNRLINSTEDMKIIRKTAIAPFSFCNQAMNDFRNKIKVLHKIF